MAIVLYVRPLHRLDRKQGRTRMAPDQSLMRSGSPWESGNLMMWNIGILGLSSLAGQLLVRHFEGG
jgi:hypothetical protein